LASRIIRWIPRHTVRTEASTNYKEIGFLSDNLSQCHKKLVAIKHARAYTYWRGNLKHVLENVFIFEP
jgi:HD superfamily phosphohydrolase YqeK